MYRYPAVAGSFYPAEPHTLSNTVANYLTDVSTTGQVPKAIIVPHAGYVYSGPIAATAYARLIPAALSINRVVLLGPAHRVAFQGLALSEATAFITPLGEVAIDHNSYQTLRDLPFVGFLEQAHTQEHSLEVQLPFLQTVLADFKLVPIVVGEATPQQVSQVLSRLWGNDETLLVISSDLSHYLDYNSAQQLDQHTSNSIERLDYENIGYNQACGGIAICGLLKLLAEKSLHIQTLDLRNSGDTAGDKQRVVGYGAYVVN